MTVPFTCDIDRVARVLARGGVAIVPTDTVYGLAASLNHPDAIDRIYQIKNRPRDKPIPVLVAGRDGAARLSSGLTEVATVLIQNHWPGPLTVVVAASPDLPDACQGENGTVGLRMPDHSDLLALLEACGGALAVTSANRSGQPETTSAADAVRSLVLAPDIALDCGPTSGGRPSTVVDATAEPPCVLRAGALDETAVLRSACGR